MNIHPINWDVIEINPNFENKYSTNILADLVDLGHNSGCGELEFLKKEKIFGAIQHIEDGLKVLNGAKKEIVIKSLKNRIIKKYLPKLYGNSLEETQVNIVNEMSEKTLPEYLFNLQNRYLYLKLMNKLDENYLEKRNFILYDKESKVRTGRGILGFISITAFRGFTRYETAAYKHRKLDYYIYPAYVDWTCVYLPADKKENIKRNLRFSETSVAKYLTNAVCRKLAVEFKNIHGLDIDGVLLLSVSLDEAKQSHLRNGKFLACHFLNEWENADGLDLAEYLHIEFGKRQVFYMYTPDGVPFGPGNKMYDALLADGSSLMYRKANTNVNDFNPANFGCRVKHPAALPLKGQDLNSFDPSNNHVAANYGGRRVTRRKLKRKLRQTRK